MSLNPMCSLSQRNIYEMFTIAKVERTKSEETYFFLSFKDKIAKFARKLTRAESLLLFSLCGVWLSAATGNAAPQASLPFTSSQSLLKLMSTVWMVPSNCEWCHPIRSFVGAPFSVLNLAQHQSLFQWVGSSHPVIQVLKLQLQHQSFQWIFRVDSFRTDWFDLLAVEGTLKNLLQHHNLKASILQHSAFFMVRLSHPYMTSGKTIALTVIPLLAKWYLCFLICCLILS